MKTAIILVFLIIFPSAVPAYASSYLWTSAHKTICPVKDETWIEEQLALEAELFSAEVITEAPETKEPTAIDIVSTPTDFDASPEITITDGGVLTS